MKTGYCRTIYIKDLACTKAKVSIWRQPYNKQMTFEKGGIYSFRNMKTDKSPDQKPHHLQTSWKAIMKECSELQEEFDHVPLYDGKVESMFLEIIVVIYISILCNFHYICTFFNKLENF